MVLHVRYYIATSGYVLVINNSPVAVGSFGRGRTEKSVFTQEFLFTTREDVYLTTSDMLKALTDTAQRDFSNNDCFCCIIRSTRTEHGICGTDGKPIDIKTITSLFSSAKCPSLDGKPKIFILEVLNSTFSSHFGMQEFIDLPLKGRKARDIVISEKDFLVWSLIDNPLYFGGSKWLRLLSHGHPLGDVIKSTSSTISLVSTLTKDVCFLNEKKNPLA